MLAVSGAVAIIGDIRPTTNPVYLRRIAKASDNSDGSRRLRQALKALAFTVSRNKARKLILEPKPKLTSARNTK